MPNPPAGSVPTIFYPTIRVAPDGTPPPPRNQPYGEPWDAPWRILQNLDTPVDVDFDNPQIPIKTRDNGVIGYMPSGDDDITIKTTTHTPTWQEMLWTTGMREVVAAAVAEAYSLLISTGNTNAGATVTVTLRVDTGTGSLTDFPVTVPANATAEQTAAAIRATTITGYTLSGTGATVLLTATGATTGPRLNPVFVTAGSVVGAITVSEFMPDIVGGYLDKAFQHYFSVGIEGQLQAGGLFSEDRFVRFFAYKVKPVEEGGGRGRGGGGGGGGGGRRRGGGGGGRGGGGSAGSVSMTHAGEGGNYQVALQMECLPQPNLDTIMADLGYPDVLIDPAKRANWFNIKKPV